MFLAKGRTAGIQSLGGPKGGVWALDSGLQGLGGLVGTSARDAEPGPAYLQPPQRRDNPGWQEKPSLHPWGLGVGGGELAKEGREMGHRSREGGVARDRGGPEGERVENRLPLGAPRGLVNHALGQIRAREKVLPFWRVAGAQRGPTSSRGCSNVAALGGNVA